MKGHRYDPDRDWGAVGQNPYDDPDRFHAMNDYSAAARDSWAQGEAPPAFDVTDWRTAEAEPTHPAWSCQGCELHPAEPEPGPDPYQPLHARPGRWWNR